LYNRILAEGADGESVTGSIVAIEVSHDMDEDEYVFTSTLDATTSKDGDRFQKLAKGALANKLRSIFQSFPQVSSFCVSVGVRLLIIPANGLRR
jgi:hypothetical protein